MIEKIDQECERNNKLEGEAVYAGLEKIEDGDRLMMMTEQLAEMKWQEKIKSELVRLELLKHIHNDSDEMFDKRNIESQLLEGSKKRRKIQHQQQLPKPNINLDYSRDEPETNIIGGSGGQVWL